MISEKPFNTRSNVPARTLTNGSELRVVVISNAQPRFIWRLAERLRNEVPGGIVCGVVYVHPETKPANFLWRSVRSATKRIGETFLDWVHGCPGASRRHSNFTENDLAQCGLRAGWQLTSVCRVSLSLDFITSCAADLCIALGDLDIDKSIGQLCRRGAIVVAAPQHYLDPNCRNLAQEISLDTVHIREDSVERISGLSPNIPVEPYDTTTSLLLKTNLIATDLATEAAARVVNGYTGSEDRKTDTREDALPHLSYWRRRKYPNANVRPLSRYARPRWRLCLAQTLLFPYVLTRNWYRRLLHRFPITILVHHLISDVPHRLGMPTDALYREIEFLKAHYRIVSLSEAVDLLNSGTVSEPTVVLTFDDGYQENFITLRAVLEATRVPVSMFVCTGIVSSQSHFLHDDQPCAQSDFLSLSWDQVSYLHAVGVEIGSHTRSHFDCGSSSLTILDEEITGSKHDLEKHLNAPARFFAFPFGKRDNISTEATNIAASCYDYLLSSCSGDNFASPAFKERHLMRKSLPHNCWELELTLQSVLDLREEIKQAFNTKAKRVRSTDAIATSPMDQQPTAL